MAQHLSLTMSSALKLVPWESWAAWNEVRIALFSSSSSSNMDAALRRVSSWRARNSLPVAVEVTGDLLSIQNADPFFSGTSGLCGKSMTDEMLCLMYAMAIMRLVNGVVDQSKKQNSTSVASRAEAAGLPRMLVDIRHEVAHKELPSLSYLRLASKQALEWLKVHYWHAQKKILDDAREHLKEKLSAYADVIEQGNQSMIVAGNKDIEKELVKLISSNVQDVISILSNDGFLNQCIGGNRVWCHVVTRLCSRVPQLFKEVISWVMKLKSEESSAMELVNLLLAQACEKPLANRRANTLIKLCNVTPGLLVEDRDKDNAEQEVHVPPKVMEDEIDFDFEKCGSALLEARKRVQSLCERKHVVATVVSEVKKGGRRNAAAKRQAEENGNGSRNAGWTMAANWRPCAIGMLPSPLHSAGVLPFFGALSSDVAKQLNGSSLNEAQVEVNASVDDGQCEAVSPKNNAAEHDGATIFKRMKQGIDDDSAHASSQKGEATTSKNALSLPKEYSVQEANQVKSLEESQHVAVPQGCLMLHGLYQRCHAEQLASIQAAIQILK